MPDFGLSPDTIFVVTAAFLLAGLVKGVVGGGLPAVAVPIMANIIAPAVAAAVHQATGLLLTELPILPERLLEASSGGRT